MCGCLRSIVCLLQQLTTLVMKEPQGSGTLLVTECRTTVSCKDRWVVLHPGRELIPMADGALSSWSNDGGCLVCFVFLILVMVRIYDRSDRVDCAVRMDVVGWGGCHGWGGAWFLLCWRSCSYRWHCTLYIFEQDLRVCWWWEWYLSICLLACWLFGHWWLQVVFGGGNCGWLIRRRG